MKQRLLIVVMLGLLVGISQEAWSQQDYLVYYQDKDGVEFNPYTYFDQHTIDRRMSMGIELDQYTDRPVKASYEALVRSKVTELRFSSRWFNASAVKATEEEIEQVGQMPFVKDILLIRKAQLGLAEKETDKFLPDEDEKLWIDAQLDRMGEDLLEENSIRAKGVRIAVFDIGFKSWKTNPAFEHIRKAGNVKKTWDFVKNKENVDGYGTHGTMVLSCIGGIVDGQKMGLATEAEFLLARTETWTEFYGEELNWLAASEWADKNGADIINSSLGYTYHRYFPEEMNGQQSLVAKAANMAASKGILVVNSAGNEGDGDWKIIGSPADADSVLSIGGIHPSKGVHTSFSSFGPTRDKRMKPNLTAYGHVIASGPSGLKETQGTSFSGPLVAGFAACAKQLRPAFNNMALYAELERSGDLHPYYDYAHGYGVPQASYFLGKKTISSNKLTIEHTSDRVYIRVDAAEASAKTIIEGVTEFNVSYHTEWPDYVFYHIENNRGYLDKYFVVDPSNRFGGFAAAMTDADEGEEPLAGSGPLVIQKKDHQRPFIVRAYYQGEVVELKID